mmetsp:Transcript_5733/g.18938  ORF Transcript_5733/g.18938 Transcript_5733/m.18938 type:complete len:272 (+) Transcript_5733:817-1632(+)
MHPKSGMSTAVFDAHATTASIVPTGMGVKSRMKLYTCEWFTPSSAFRVMAAIVATAFAGNAPLAVSPLSMVASAPSNTAFATSNISARVGNGFSHMDSSICVATITNLPAMLHLVIIIFCASATFSEGISIPRSPRATITPSVYLRISSKFSMPASFSILQMICTFCPPASSRIRRMKRTSSPVCTNDAARKSILFLQQKFCTSWMSLSVRTGMSTLTPGRLQFFRSPSFLEFNTVPLSTVTDSIESTLMEMLPSAIRMLFPTFTDWHSLA